MNARRRDALGFAALVALAASPLIIIAAAVCIEGRFW